MSGMSEEQPVTPRRGDGEDRTPAARPTKTPKTADGAGSTDDCDQVEVVHIDHPAYIFINHNS